MDISEISNDQSTVIVTSVSNNSDPSNPILKVGRHCFKPSESVFESSAQRETSLNIAHKILSLKTHEDDNCSAVLLNCKDEAQDSSKIVCCHWTADGTPVVDDLFTYRGPDGLSEPIYVKDSLRCVCSKDTVIFIDVSKASVTGKICVDEDIQRILSACCLDDGFLVLLLCQCAETKSKNLKLLSVDHSLSQSDKHIDVNDIIPSLYADVVTCAFVQIHKHFEQHSKSLDCSAYVCTNRKQLVFFKNGRIARCLPLPFHDAKHIQQYITPSFQKILVVQNESRSVVCIDEGSGKVIKTYEDVQACLADDFLCNGSEQLLVIFDHSLTSFILLDFETVHINKSSKDSAQYDTTLKDQSEQFTQVLNALSHRLQVGRASLAQSEACLKEKEALIERTCQNIEKMAIGETTYAVSSDNLVPLLPLKSPLSDPPIPSPCRQSTVVQVLDTWKRVLFGQLVIGVKLKHSMNSCLLKPSLLVSPSSETSKQRCISRTFVQSLSVEKSHIVQASMGAPQSKRRRPAETVHSEFRAVNSVDPGQCIYVTGSIPMDDVGLWNKLDVTLSLLWHCGIDSVGGEGEHEKDDSRSKKQKGTVEKERYSEKENSNSITDTVAEKGDDERSKKRKGTGEKERSIPKESTHVIVVGHESIEAKELLQLELSCCKAEKPELIEQEMIKELLCLQTVQLLSELLVTSTVSSVSAVHKILRDELGFRPCKAFQGLICCENRGLFYHVRVEVEVEERCKGKLHVWTRDVPQLLLLLRALYFHSPDDLLILPANQNARNIQPAVKAIHREISLVAARLQKVVTTGKVLEQLGTDEGNEGTDIAMETDGELSKPQRDFISERSRILHHKRRTLQPISNLEEVKNARVQLDEAMLGLMGPS